MNSSSAGISNPRIRVILRLGAVCWAVTLILHLAGCSGGRLTLQVSDTDSPGWITARGGNDNRGAVRQSAGADRLIWESKTGGVAAGEPTVAGRYIYFPGLDRRLEVFDAQNGKRVFRERFDGPVTGAIPRDSVFEFLTDQDEFRYFSYGLAPKNGRESFRVARTRASPRRFADSLILIVGLDGTLYCHKNDGEVLWQAETAGPVRTAPAIVGSTAYVSSGRQVVAIDLTDGSRRWSHQSTAAVPSAPAVDEFVYVGTADSIVYALNRDDGGMAWFHVVNGAVMTTPTVGDSHIYIAANDGLIYALEKMTGKPVWTFDTGAIANLAPTLAGERLYVASRTGHLIVLGAADGHLIQRHGLRASAATSPVVANGHVYLADTSRRLYCFGPADTVTAEGE